MAEFVPTAKARASYAPTNSRKSKAAANRRVPWHHSILIADEYLHVKAGRGRLLESLCLRCHSKLGASPFRHILLIVERIHRCNPEQPQSRRSSSDNLARSPRKRYRGA
jgi:hypothetical protein